MNGIYQDCDQFWKFSNAYISSLTSYGLITGLADFHFTEQCYWYFQSTLNPCLKAAPLSVEKPDLTNIILFLQSFFHLSSLRQVILVLSEPYELVPSQFFSTWVAMCNNRVKRSNNTMFTLTYLERTHFHTVR